jgi:N-acetylglucosamine kinase-like BadF-type ATPase
MSIHTRSNGSGDGRSADQSLVLAVDGGNSKTDLALVRADGSLVSFVRGPRSSPQHLGLDGCARVLTEILDEACRQAGLERADGPVADVAEVLVAGLDLPADEEDFNAVMDELGWGRRTIVGNDTFAVLRAGTESGWGIAVVCGAGINCIGVGPDGRRVRFPALGAISGDWGGGLDIGLAALSAAARSEDGRGPLTTLEQEVPAHFGLGSPLELAEAVHLKTIPAHRLAELSPVVLERAADDPVCAAIVDRLAAEVVAFVRVAVSRLELSGQPVEVILGGGVLRSGNTRLFARIDAGLRELGPAITVLVSASPPIVGAALLALDEIGVGPAARESLRCELGEAVGVYDEKNGSTSRLQEANSMAVSSGRKRDG